MSTFRQLMMRKKGGGIPARYTVVDYILLSADEPYDGSMNYFHIDTGLYGSTTPSDNYSCEMTFVATDTKKENALIINAWNINSYFLLHYSNNVVWHGVNGGSTVSTAISNDTKYTIKIDIQEGRIYKDGVSVATFTAGSCGTTSIKLFGGYSLDAWYHSFRGKVDGIKFYAPNGDTVRNYVPVYDTVSQKYGFYETIQQQFKGNEGTKTFSGGND